MDSAELQGFQDVDLLKKYHEAISMRDENLRNQCREILFKRCAKMYYLIANKVHRLCGSLERAECVGWIENGSWHTGYLGQGVAKGHNAAVEKYHPLPATLSKIDFEENILGKTNEHETQLLKSIFHSDEASDRYTIDVESTPGTFWRRWDISVRIGFMAAKFSSFAYIICLREMRNYCQRNCMYTTECREQLREITPENYVQFFGNNRIREQIKPLLKNLYAYNLKERVYKLKREATPAQLRALRDINAIYPFTVVRCDHPTALTIEEHMVLTQIITLAISVIEELSLMEQYLVYLLMRDVPQKFAGRLLRMSEVNVSRRIRHIEATLAKKLATALDPPCVTEMLVTLKELRQVSEFNKAYSLYEKRKSDRLYAVREMHALFKEEK